MNKEQIYDEQIAPLMAQVIKIATEHGIAALVSFAIPTPEDAGLMVTTLLPSNDPTPSKADKMLQASGLWLAQDDSRLLRKQLAMSASLAVMTVMVDKKPEGQG